MLRYKHINEVFYTDTFFATGKAGKSTRGNTCCQLFVTDKGYVYLVPMKEQKQFLSALKLFAREIGAPDVLVADPATTQKKDEVKQFCNDIGTSLKVLERGTQWANRAELYVGLLKKAINQDMRESNAPLVFWDYCGERRASIHNFSAGKLL